MNYLIDYRVYMLTVDEVQSTVDKRELMNKSNKQFPDIETFFWTLAKKFGWCTGEIPQKSLNNVSIQCYANESTYEFVSRENETKINYFWVLYDAHEMGVASNERSTSRNRKNTGSGRARFKRD